MNRRVTEKNLPLRRMQQTRYGFYDGGLSGAVGADQADDFPLLDFKRDILNGRKSLIPDGNIIDRQHDIYPLSMLE